MNLQEELNLPFPLRPYQEEGVEFLTSNDSALLGDDMGLGKTVQVLVAMSQIQKKDGVFRALIVVPNALVSNWQKEFKIWIGKKVSLTVVKGAKEDRDFYFKNTKGFSICTYEQIRSSFGHGKQVPKYDLVVFDEAHRLKNSNTTTHQAAKFIRADKKWFLTGTPIENKQEDLINIFNILKPGTLQLGFNRFEIRDIFSEYFLRRLKKDHLKELPELIEQDIYIDMTSQQRIEYNAIETSNAGSLDSNNLFSLITKLKIACNFSPDSNESGKLNYLNRILIEKHETNESVIIFSQYVKTLKKISENLNHEFLFYHGGMTKEEKDESINSFMEEDNSKFMLMSLKAGAVGLNLQKASVVVLFDRWWNPAIEKQAIARAYRMGNKNTVHALKFITPNSIEDRIIELLHEKEELFDDIIEGAVTKQESKILLKLLEPKPN